jgi:hypothetical protein
MRGSLLVVLRPPRDGPPVSSGPAQGLAVSGSRVLSGPIGTTSSSSQFLFMYPNKKLNDPSGFSSHPSYAGDAFWPLEYVSDWAPPCWPIRRTASATSRSLACPALRPDDGTGDSLISMVAIPHRTAAVPWRRDAPRGLRTEPRGTVASPITDFRLYSSTAAVSGSPGTADSQ